MRREQISLIALVELINDPDPLVFEQIAKDIKLQGIGIISTLEDAMNDGTIEAENFDKINALIREIQFKELLTELSDWIISPEKDLMLGAYLVNKYQFPELSYDTFKNGIWSIRKDIWLEINQKQTAFETIQTFNKVFYGHHSFKVTSFNLSTPFELYLHSVMQTGDGENFALGLLYSIIAQSLDIPVYKIVQPNGNSILAYIDEHQTLSQLNLMKECNGILCYINTDNSGAIIDSLSLQEKLKKLGMRSRKAFFEPSSNTTIIKAYLRKLIDSCRNVRNGSYKSSDLQLMLNLFDF